MSYRWALIGIAGGMTLLTAWCVASGMTPWVALLLMLLTFLFMIGVHRMMAEGGINLLWAAQSGPNYFLNAIGGAKLISPQTWLVLLALPYFAWNFKGPVGPQALEGFKLVDAAGVRTRGLTPLAVVGLVVAIVASYWSVIYLVHAHGGGAALDAYRFQHVGQRPSAELMSVGTNPEGCSMPKVLAMAAAAGFTFLLAAMRWRFVWWPFHPIGYAASTIWAANYMWFSMLVGSVLSFAVIHAGGLRLYRQVRPAFLGLIFGDFLMVGVWLVVNGLTGIRGYSIFGS